MGIVLLGERGDEMRFRTELAHEWRPPVPRAEAIQRALAELVVVRALPAEGEGAPRLVAGVDVGYDRPGARAWAAAVLMDERFRALDAVVVAGEPDLPYTPGLLAFREGRITIEALLALETAPDLVFCDGHGVVHERGLGLASHIGVLLDVPVVGVPKTPFHAIDRQPEGGRGAYYVLTKEWGAQGASLRLKAGVKPVYVSPGHLVDLESAIALCLHWSSGTHRFPEPLQAAHTLSSVARAEGRERELGDDGGGRADGPSQLRYARPTKSPR